MTGGGRVFDKEQRGVEVSERMEGGGELRLLTGKKQLDGSMNSN